MLENQRPNLKTRYFYEAHTGAGPRPTRRNPYGEREAFRVWRRKFPERETLGGRRAPRGPADSVLIYPQMNPTSNAI